MLMSPSFDSLVEEVRSRSAEEKVELRFLLERDLINERRREIRASHVESIAEAKRGALKFSDSLDQLKKSLGSR